MKYLHIITKDQFYSKEFIDLIHSNLKINEHKFIIIKKKTKNSYINPEEYQNIESFIVSSEENILKIIVSYIKFFPVKYMKIRRLLKQADNIIVHFLTEEVSLILFRFRGKAKIFWVIWGDDLYKYLPLKLYDYHTSELLSKLESKMKSIIKRLYYSFFHQIRKSVIKRLDYVSTTLKGDVKLLKKYFKTEAKWYSKDIYPNPIDLKKIDLEVNSFDDKFKFKKKGEKLLFLGNSGSKTNNHLDILIILSKIKVQNFNIICPLSYGNPIYIKKIIEKGKMLFGDRFKPLLEFLTPEVYYQILKKVDLTIMYHNRQQGRGTIIILLYLGKPLCMKKTSLYFNFIENKVLVFSTKDLERLILNEIEFTEVMSKNNRKIASQYLSVKSVISSIENLSNFLEDRNER